jgi:predicted PhzF superfamily epimerase YddE/YHI9
MLGSVEQVLSLEPDAAGLAGLDLGVVGPRGKVGVVAPAPASASGAADWLFEVRAFFSAAGSCREDPVTGSLNAAVAQWLIESGLAPKAYVARQGTRLGREGRVHIECDSAGTVWVGGDCCDVLQGKALF